MCQALESLDKNLIGLGLRPPWVLSLTACELRIATPAQPVKDVKAPHAPL